MVLVAALMALLGLCACAATPMNAPLPHEALAPAGHSISTGGYRLAALAQSDRDPGLLVLLAFSGGGKRSSAFGYGVLKGLRDFAIPTSAGERPLLDQVDLISAVSGGSFPAAYYGLYRDRIFSGFEKDFLKTDIESYVYGTFLLPWHLRWLFDSTYGTNDRMAEVYDDLMFHGATFADLIRNGRPLISINATDVDHGAVFPFTQDQFDLICSDLSSYPLARAVAASNGFPILFPPITLTSYTAQCGGRAPSWLDEAGSGDPFSRKDLITRTFRLYLDPEKTRYVHLLDGGIADNLGMRSVINEALVLASQPDVLAHLKLTQVRQILLISADGQAAMDSSSAREAEMSSLHEVLNAASGTQIDAYNFETLVLAREEMADLADAIEAARCGPAASRVSCVDVKSTFVHLSLADVGDSTLRDRLQHVPTGLTLPDQTVDELVAAGEAVVLGSPELQRFRQSLSDAVGDLRASR